MIFNPLTQEAFELRNVPSGGRELTFVQENGLRRVFDASGALINESRGLLEIPMP